MSRPSPFRISSYLPPIVFNAIASRTRRYGFFGNYATWEEAGQDSTGYDAQIILERVRDSLLKVRDGKAAYERDSVLFEHVEYSYPLLASLLRIASANGNRLSVLDFGGSLGSSYFQCRTFLAEIKELRWSIIEQPHFVACGKQHFQNDQLRFYECLEDCLKERSVDVLLLSSVLQYFREPYQILESYLSQDISYVIIDRMPLFADASDRIVVQKVPPEIYAASYPAWICNYRQMVMTLTSRYQLLAEFDALDGECELGSDRVFHKGFLLRSSKTGLAWANGRHAPSCDGEHGGSSNVD